MLVLHEKGFTFDYNTFISETHCTILISVTGVIVQGVFFLHWYPPKELKYGKPRLGESTLT